jgi:hypothetical protein
MKGFLQRYLCIKLLMILYIVVIGQLLRHQLKRKLWFALALNLVLDFFLGKFLCALYAFVYHTGLPFIFICVRVAALTNPP